MKLRSVTDDELLALFGRYTYLTSAQICRRYFGHSLEHVRRRVLALKEAGFLTVLTDELNHRAGRDAYIWTLTRAGQQHVADLGYPLPSRFYKPHKPGYRMFHTLGVTDFFLALHRLSDEVDGVLVDSFLHEMDFDREPERVKLADGSTINVKPDGWARVYVGEEVYSMALEYDRGTEEEKRWRPKISALLAWAGSGQNERIMGGSLVIATVAEPGITRRNQLIRWTELELKRLGREADAQLFLFTGERPDQMDPRAFFSDAHWFEPFNPKPYSLLDLGVRELV